jgi:hypothetical protein
MIRKSVQRFSEKIMLKQQPKARRRFIPISSHFRQIREIIMRLTVAAAIADAFVRVFPASSLQANVHKQTALFCGAALLVWLLSETYGLDLSVGFF